MNPAEVATTMNTILKYRFCFLTLKIKAQQNSAFFYVLLEILPLILRKDCQSLSKVYMNVF